VNQAAINYHFGGKDSLYCEVLRTAFRALTKQQLAHAHEMQDMSRKVSRTGLAREWRDLTYIMTFAGYNAGRGRVQEWVAQHGDPRDPKVDAVDWVERIPFAETRKYVQRVTENLQVYRTRFGASIATLEPNLHRTAVGSRVEPILVEFPHWHR
jgi:AcrR family transcriptional regulator